MHPGGAGTDSRHLTVGTKIAYVCVVSMITFLTIRTSKQNFRLAGKLVLTWLEFIFFIGVSMELCFWFVTKTVLIKSAYTEPRSFLLLTSQWGVWVCTRSWEGSQLGQLTPSDQRAIPYHSIHNLRCCAQQIKLGEKGQQGAFLVLQC